MSQTELAHRTGIAQANLSNIENGKQDITVSTLLQICLALGVKPSSILDTAVKSRPKARFARVRLERLAAAVVGRVRLSSKEDHELVRLLRKSMVLGGRKISSKEATLHWADLRQRLTDDEIATLRQRIEDALQRKAHEKKHR